eukprot:6182325-Pleurochrysis_carterae.AAC.2
MGRAVGEGVRGRSAGSEAEARNRMFVTYFRCMGQRAEARRRSAQAHEQTENVAAVENQNRSLKASARLIPSSVRVPLTRGKQSQETMGIFDLNGGVVLLGGPPAGARWPCSCCSPARSASPRACSSRRGPPAPPSPLHAPE